LDLHVSINSVLKQGKQLGTTVWKCYEELTTTFYNRIDISIYSEKASPIDNLSVGRIEYNKLGIKNED
jgi:hypothetical protein